MWQRLGLWIGLCSIIVSCGTTTTPPSALTPTSVIDADSPRDTAIPPTDNEAQSPAAPLATASATAFVVPSSTPSNASAPDATAIVATVQAALPATITPDASGLTGSSLGETAVVAIWQDDSGPYFAAITTGMMDDIETPHPLTIYQKQGNTFVAVTHYDYVDGEYVVGIELIPNIDPKKSFFVVHGGIGAHSSFGTVFSFDGKNLKVEVQGGSDAGGGAITIEDVNSDGVADVVADATDYYVFCYACGVRIWNNTVYAWDADDMRVSIQMQQIYVNFVTHGNPNGAGIPTWPALQPGAPAQLLRIDTNSAIETDSHQQRYQFLDSIMH